MKIPLKICTTRIILVDIFTILDVQMMIKIDLFIKPSLLNFFSAGLTWVLLKWREVEVKDDDDDDDARKKLGWLTWLEEREDTYKGVGVCINMPAQNRKVSLTWHEWKK